MRPTIRALFASVALAAAFAVPSIPTYAAQPAAVVQAAHPTISRGSRGMVVSELQTKLNRWNIKYKIGLAPLTVSGVFGAATEARVIRFQRWAGLVRDGVVGPKTWAALDRAVGAVVQRSISLSATEGGIGQTIVVSGRGWAPGAVLLVSFGLPDTDGGGVLARPTVLGDGSFAVRIVIPSQINGEYVVPGPYVIAVGTSDGRVNMFARFEVVP